MASKDNPVYTTYVISGGTKYDLTTCVKELKFSDQGKAISKNVRISLANVQVQGGEWLSSIIGVRDRIHIYADDGETNDEVWRGFVWEHGYKSSTSDRLIVLTGYDNLIYSQESEESKFFAAGKQTEDVMKSLCNDWGIALEYSYTSISHSKLALRGKLSDVITSDILDLVKDRTGEKYVILSEKDVVKIKRIGQNKKVYTIGGWNNTITAEAVCTMNGMTTRVVILGKADDNDRRPVEATVDGDTAKYGTLQKLVNRDENTSLSDAKKEAQSIINEVGKPKWEYKVEAPDIPWIRKGDKVHVSAGSLIGYYIVLGIDRNISNSKKTMTLTMEDEKNG